MKRRVGIAVAAIAMALPAGATAANPGQERASECGSQHGKFARPAHGFLRDFVPGFARSGLYRGGFVGERASDPACHEDRAKGKRSAG